MKKILLFIMLLALTTSSICQLKDFDPRVSLCDCGKWMPIAITGSNIKKQLNCGQSLVVLKGRSYTINPSFACTGCCQASFSATLISPSGQTQTISSFPYTLTPTQLCSYRLIITAICGNKKCSICIIDLFVTPGCEGDSITSRKYETYEYVDVLYASDLKKKNGNFLQMDISDKEEILDGFSAGSYLFQLNKKNVSVVNAKTGRLVNSYPQVPDIPNQLKDCDEQEKEQWSWFNASVAPGLLSMANANCNRVMYCLTIYCNETPVKYNLLVVNPTRKFCAINTQQSTLAIRNKIEMMELE